MWFYIGGCTEGCGSIYGVYRGMWFYIGGVQRDVVLYRGGVVQRDVGVYIWGVQRDMGVYRGV